MQLNQRTHNLEGKRYGRWVVESFSHKVYYGRSGYHYYWNCFCSCGIRKRVLECHLKSGKSISCGCYSKENPSHKKLWIPIRIDENLLSIPLGNGIETAIIDREDYYKIKDISWHKDNEGYAHGDKIRMHQLILRCPLGYETDHKNRNRLDNRKSNLRVFIHKQNMINIGINNTNTSGYTGVSFNKRRKKYEVYININGEKRGLGYYKNLEDAAIVSSKARNEREEMYGIS
jgi:hypothetical protein